IISLQPALVSRLPITSTPKSLAAAQAEAQRKALRGGAAQPHSAPSNLPVPTISFPPAFPFNRFRSKHFNLTFLRRNFAHKVSVGLAVVTNLECNFFSF